MVSLFTFFLDHQLTQWASPFWLQKNLLFSHSSWERARLYVAMAAVRLRRG